MNDLIKTKSFWTGVAAVVTAIGGVATGTVPVAVAIQTAFTGLMGIFLRAGIAKVGK